MTTSSAASVFRHGKGILIAVLMLLGVELYLHNDDFLHRYRSVFAVGRAADKLAYVVTMQPTIVFMGNSRVDNGIAPVAMSAALGLRKGAVFNFGVPGENTRVLSGLVRELDRRGALSANQLRYILIGLDATLFSPNDDLNYSVFMADRWDMAAAGEYKDLLASIFRLWGYAANLKGLREPARMREFIAATLTDHEPWGGSVRDNLGYRAKHERLTEAAAKLAPDEASPPSLDAKERAYLLTAVGRLRSRGIRVGVFFPPRYRHSSEFETGGDEYEEYTTLLADLRARGVELFHLPDMDTYGADLFSDPGHLNEEGARRYSISLAQVMRLRWPVLVGLR